MIFPSTLAFILSSFSLSKAVQSQTTHSKNLFYFFSYVLDVLFIVLLQTPPVSSLFSSRFSTLGSHLTLQHVAIVQTLTLALHSYPSLFKKPQQKNTLLGNSSNRPLDNVEFCQFLLQQEMWGLVVFVLATHKSAIFHQKKKKRQINMVEGSL